MVSGSCQPGTGDRRRDLEALIVGELVDPVYQPIVCLRTGAVVGHECLSRPAKGSGFASAGELFDAAAQADRLWQLEDLTRRRGFGGIAGWMGTQDAEGARGVDGAGSLLFINCSPRVIADERLAASLGEAIAALPAIARERAVIEITERHWHEDEDAVLGRIDALRTIGCQVALDDVGADGAGFGRLLSIRPDWIKIDRRLISNIDRDRQRRRLVGFLVEFAADTDARTVAEGIERDEEFRTAADLGTTCGQGYLIARPTPVPGQPSEAVRRLLAGCPVPEQPGPVTASTLSSEAVVLSGTEPVASVASRVMETGASGVVLTDAGGVAGWLPRERVFEALGCGQDALASGELLEAPTAVVSPRTTLGLMLSAAAERDARATNHPLIVSAPRTAPRIVPIQDLFAAAAATSRRAEGARLAGPQAGVGHAGVPRAGAAAA